MKIASTSLLALLLLASACKRQQDEPAAPPSTQATPAAPAEDEGAPASIMRPDVAKEAAPPPPPPPPEPLRRVIGFGTSGSALDDEARAALDMLVADPLLAQGGAITLSGHSDSSGSDADNLAVSRRRAEAVRDYLISKGVPAERMTVIALGEQRPIEPNANPDGSDYLEGRQRNRRVEILVAPPAAAPPAAPAPAEPATQPEPPLAPTR